MILVVDKALLVFRVVLENGVLLFVDIVQSSCPEFFTRVFIKVFKVDLEAVLEYFSLSQLPTSKAVG